MPPQVVNQFIIFLNITIKQKDLFTYTFFILALKKILNKKLEYITKLTNSDIEIIFRIFKLTKVT